MTLTLERPTSLTLGRLTAKAITPGLWRVVHADGSVRGHISRRECADGPRFETRLLLPGRLRGMVLGEFWSLDDALECLG